MRKCSNLFDRQVDLQFIAMSRFWVTKNYNFIYMLYQKMFSAIYYTETNTVFSTFYIIAA